MNEFFSRQMFSKCGVRQDPIDCFKSDCFAIINGAITKFQNDETKKARLRRHGRR